MKTLEAIALEERTYCTYAVYRQNEQIMHYEEVRR